MTRETVLNSAREFFAKNHGAKEIRPGEDYIPVSGKVLDEDDLVTLIDSSLDLWLTAGRYANEFERDFAKFMGQHTCLLVNSGSSANLVAVATLTSDELGDRRLRPGDEVITVAAGFPTTVNPIVQMGCVPVFVDVTLGNYEIDVSQLDDALSEKTKAVVLAHTLGNAFDVATVSAFCKKNGLWLIEDCCDAVGTTFDGKMVGTFGDLATVSFYPAHHMTMGEGGAVLSNNKALKRIAESFRDWGRDCWCPPGKDNTCGKRFNWQLADLPEGYDHKYIYRHIGFNLKATDMQAALGVSQLRKLPTFIKQRRANFTYLYERLSALSDRLILPEATPRSDPSWFGFPISLRDDVQVTRRELTRELENRRIGTRLLFGGNLLRQPLYKSVNTRSIGTLPNTDYVMSNTLWLGVYPALSVPHFDYIAEQIEDILS